MEANIIELHTQFQKKLIDLDDKLYQVFIAGQFMDAYDGHISSVSELQEAILYLHKSLRSQLKKCKYSLKHDFDKNFEKMMKRFKRLQKKLIMQLYFCKFYPIIKELDETTLDINSLLKLGNNIEKPETTDDYLEQYMVNSFLIAKEKKNILEQKNKITFVNSSTKMA